MKGIGKHAAMVAILCGLVAAGPHVVYPAGVTSSTMNPLQIALLHWYNANLTTIFGAGNNPRGLTFDRANIWAVNNVSNNVTKLRANDGVVDPRDFIVIGSCRSSLAPHATCVISISFDPKAAGTRTGQLSVTDSPDATSPYQVTLTGIGR